MLCVSNMTIMSVHVQSLSALILLPIVNLSLEMDSMTSVSYIM